MKTLQEALIDSVTPESYDSLARGGDYDNVTSKTKLAPKITLAPFIRIVDRAAKLAENTKKECAELEELKKQLRFFSDEIGDRVLRGNEYKARVTPAKQPTTPQLKTKRAKQVLTKLYGEGVLSRYMLDSCYESKTPAHRVTFVKE